MAENERKAKTDPSRKDKKEPGKLGRLFRRLGRFFTDLRSELKRVVWPDRKKLVSSTLIVLAICIAAAVFLWIVDTVLMGVLNAVGFYNSQSTTVATTTAAIPAVTTTVSTTASTTTAAAAPTTTAKP
ncbi:MAG: preprotein translocase subunit SecE [Clostridia bacterium]|nr:preprotein translocase subunit SecE [Clostridia bacterium]